MFKMQIQMDSKKRASKNVSKMQNAILEQKER